MSTYLETLMQAEREFFALAAKKLEQSKNPRIPLCQRKRNEWDSLKCYSEAKSYQREIEQIAEETFPLSLSLEINDLLTPSAL